MEAIDSFFKSCRCGNCCLDKCVKIMNNHKEDLNSLVTSKPLLIEPRNGYQRNVVFRSDEYEIIVIAWEPGARSPIHDHAERGCCMLVCRGELTEDRFRVVGGCGCDNTETYRNTYRQECVELIGRNQISDRDGATYINNREGVHQIHNLTSETVYSVHIYSPPLHCAKMFLL